MPNTFSAVPKNVWDKFAKMVDHADFECVDNYRAYRIRDKWMIDDYREAELQGCCGYYDTSVIDDNGDEWLVGCNYGH